MKFSAMNGRADPDHVVALRDFSRTGDRFV
jgi:hypothetical protein